jgi:hypothetical protein
MGKPVQAGEELMQPDSQKSYLTSQSQATPKPDTKVNAAKSCNVTDGNVESGSLVVFPAFREGHDDRVRAAHETPKAATGVAALALDKRS